MSIEEKAEEWLREFKGELFSPEVLETGVRWYTEQDIKRAFLAGAAADKWVKCSERLPKIGVPVMLCDEFGAYWLGELQIDGRIHYHFGHDFIWGKVFTHWQPLPEPPKEEHE